jgi:polar amino acid transport system substrate-binding protein
MKSGAVRKAGVALVLASAAFSSMQAAARPLDAIEARGSLTLCAHANALPFASRKDDPPGFQIELGRALARELGVGFAVGWVISSFQYRTADCDIILDAIVDDEVQAQARLRVSKPYHRTGVALALRKSIDGIRSFRDLDDGKRIGVQMGSMAHMVLNQRGVQTISFAFEDEMIEAVASGEIDGAAVSPPSIAYFNLTHPDQAVRLIHAYEQEADLSWNVAVGMRGSDDPLRQKVDAAIDRLLADGTIRNIYARYGVEHRPPAGSR